MNALYHQLSAIEAANHALSGEPEDNEAASPTNFTSIEANYPRSTHSSSLTLSNDPHPSSEDPSPAEQSTNPIPSNKDLLTLFHQNITLLFRSIITHTIAKRSQPNSTPLSDAEINTLWTWFGHKLVRSVIETVDGPSAESHPRSQEPGSGISVDAAVELDSAETQAARRDPLTAGMRDVLGGDHALLPRGIRGTETATRSVTVEQRSEGRRGGRSRRVEGPGDGGLATILRRLRGGRSSSPDGLTTRGSAMPTAIVNGDECLCDRSYQHEPDSFKCYVSRLYRLYRGSLTMGQCEELAREAMEMRMAGVFSRLNGSATRERSKAKGWSRFGRK